MNGIKFPIAKGLLQTGAERFGRAIPAAPLRQASVRRTFDAARQAHPGLNRLFTDTAASAERLRGKFSAGGLGQASGGRRAASTPTPDYRRPVPAATFHARRAPMSDYSKMIQALEHEVETSATAFLQRLTKAVDYLNGAGQRYGFQQQPSAFAGQYCWRPAANHRAAHAQYGPQHGGFGYQPFQYHAQGNLHQSFMMGDPQGFVDSWRRAYAQEQAAFHFNAQSAYANHSSSGMPRQPPEFASAGAKAMPDKAPKATPGAVDISVQRSTEEWQAVVSALQKKGMSRDDLAQWQQDFSTYVNHGGSGKDDAFNEKYARFISGDVSDSTMRSNYVRLRKAITKTLAESPD